MEHHTDEDRNGELSDVHQSFFDGKSAEAAALVSSDEQDKLQELKKKRVYSLAAVSKKKNQLSKLMTSERNLSLVKSELDVFIDLMKRYDEAYMLYFLALTKPKSDKEAEEFAEKNETFSDFKASVMKWIYVIEQRLQNNTGRVTEGSCRSSQKSRSSSHRSSEASSKAARAKEKARLAELLVEKSMMKQKQALQTQEQELLLNIEIAKCKAREEAYASELEGNLSVSLPEPAAVDFIPDLTSPTSPQLELEQNNENGQSPDHNVRSLPASGHLEKEISQVLSAVKAKEKKTHLNPDAPAFHTNAQIYQAMQKDFVNMQQMQNEQILAAHQTLASAVSLPQPKVPKFKGDPIEFNTFLRSFDARIAPLASKADDLIYYLEQHLEGEAKEIISGCLFMEPYDGYTEARSLLEKEYGDPFKISMAYISKVLDWPVVKHDDTKGLKKFSIFLIQCNQAMKSISHMQVLDHAPNMQSIVQKLPAYLQNKWRDCACKHRRQKGSSYVTTFEDLVLFIKQAAETANDPVFGMHALKPIGINSKSKIPTDRKTPNKPAISSFATKPKTSSASTDNPASSSASYKKTCIFCREFHDIDKCQAFNRKTVDERRAYLKEKKLCFGCFGTGHTSRGCLKKRSCAKCGKLHPTSLHIDGFQLPNVKQEEDSRKVSSSNEGNEVKSQVSSGACNTTTSETIFHAILPVKVHQRGSDVCVSTYGFYDNGSSGCFLTEDLAQELQIKGTETTLQLKTMHGTNYVSSQSVNDIVVADVRGENAILLPKAFTRDVIPVSHQQIPKRETMKHFPYLEKIANEMPDYLPNIEIGLLIGSNCPLALEPLEVLPSDDGGPFAVKLRHGWTINGPVQIAVREDAITCNRIIVREIEATKEVPLPSEVLKMFGQDFEELDHGSVPGELGYSKEDIKFLDIVKECAKDESGHYVIPLPFRKEELLMPNNRENALTRAKWQRRKMLQNKAYHQDYCKFMDMILSKGYATKAEIESSSLSPGKYWFLPHHGVYHSKKLDKL